MAMQTSAIQEDKGNGIFHKAMSSEKPVWIPGPVIIGAGPSGLAVAACLKERGVPFLILEKERCIGSLWTLKTYNRLQLHLPKETCKLPHMPFPPEVPAYPTKQQFISYLEAYAKHFAIEPMFRQEVQSAIYDARMGFWRVQSNESEFLCRWFIVATGENAEPVLPNIEGISDFKGSLIHTSRYKDGADFKGQKVLVVGCGNSGMEISLDLCNNDAQVSLAVRDKVKCSDPGSLAPNVYLYVLLFQLLLKHVVCGVQRFTASGAEFVDGHVENFDSVILATGYRSNVTSWLKEDNFFNEKDGYPRNPFPDNWKGKNGLYSVGFTRRGLLGSSIDAQRVAEDIARQWNCETKHLRIESLP
ncbi:hypothetical protein Peur_067270 [Populus x canadensis]